MSSAISDNSFSVADVQSAQKSQTALPANQRLSEADMVSQDSYTPQNAQGAQKKKNNTGLWVLGGLAAGVAALALIKKDGEPLIKRLFSRGRQELPTSAADTLERTAPAPDPSLVDPDMGAHASEMMADNAQALSRLGRRRIRDRVATWRNYRSMDEASFITAQLGARRAQAQAMVTYQDAGAALERARAKYEASIARIAAQGNSVNSAAKEQRASQRLHTATLAFTNATAALRQANQTAARHGL